MSMIPITGNTYPVREQIKALGGRWNADKKAWMVPEAVADQARKLVTGASAATKSGRRYFSRCADCGAATQGYYRCRDCNMERRIGGSRYMGGQSYHYTDDSGRRQFVLGDDD